MAITYLCQCASRIYILLDFSGYRNPKIAFPSMTVLYSEGVPAALGPAAKNGRGVDVKYSDSRPTQSITALQTHSPL